MDPGSRRRISRYVCESFAGDPVDLATQLRVELGLGGDPILSVVALLQELGCILGPIPDVGRDVSAFSCWFDEEPVALIRQAGEGRRRVRFDTAHELGHLLMHRGVADSHAVEKQADRFAGALLLPATLFPSFPWRPFSWDAVQAVSELFGTTTLATLYRAHEVGAISEVVFRAAQVWASGRGYRHQDPTDHEFPERVPAFAG